MAVIECKKVIQRFPISLPADEFLPALEAKRAYRREVDMPAGSNIVRAGVHIVVSEETIIDPRTKQLVRMPVAKEVVSVWAEVPQPSAFDDEKDQGLARMFLRDDYTGARESKLIFILQDDFALPAGTAYLSTFAMNQGQTVFHIYTYLG